MSKTKKATILVKLVSSLGTGERATSAGSQRCQPLLNPGPLLRRSSLT